MDNTIIINKINRTIGQLLIQVGMKKMWNSISEFSDIQGDFNKFKAPLLGLPVSQLDEKYYFISFDNWLKIIETLNPILKEFGWKAERRDCDDRALFITAMVSFLFEINTCRPVYCEVWRVGDGQFAYAHYANVIVDNAGNAWLWDADENGEYTKITSTTPIIGNKKYVLKAIR
jgi:hypothetical protein